MLKTLMDLMPDLIYFKDRNSRFTLVNLAHATHFGLTNPSELIGKSDLDFYPLDRAQALFAGEQGMMESGKPLISAIEDQAAYVGHPCWFQTTKVPIVRDGQVTGLVGISRNVTDLKMVEERLAHQAMHDTLTGLPNRVLLHDRLEQLMHRARRTNTSFALCVLDLDHFKEVNDTIGHACGDRLLQEVATRLHATVRASDSMARLGGDEFAILLPDTDVAGAIAVACELRGALEEPLDLNGHQLDIPASIGIAVFPLHTDEIVALQSYADIAMHIAKQSGGGYAVYDAHMNGNSSDRLTLPLELRRALPNNELYLQYQPLLELASSQVTAVEALIRWQHPRRGLIPPLEFLPLAQRIGMLGQLTAWVLDTALQQCRAWAESGLCLRVAVNISPRTLLDSQLPYAVAQALMTHNVPADRLILEITEEALLTDPEKSLAVLNELRQIGVQISIDDFGTGFSSLAYLRQLPVTAIKIDKSFVIGMEPGQRDEAIVHSVIELSHSLGMTVVAEGIEDKSTLEHLIALGCDTGQGFFVCKPTSAAAVESFIRTSLSDLPRHGAGVPASGWLETLCSPPLLKQAG
jgi:diguanylate cyclase (GGDEF)-like protein/PAS domain S-box-containing protein